MSNLEKIINDEIINQVVSLVEEKVKEKRGQKEKNVSSKGG